MFSVMSLEPAAKQSCDSLNLSRETRLSEIDHSFIRC